MRIALFSENFPLHQTAIGGLVLHLLEDLEAEGHTCLLLTPQELPLRLGRTQAIGVDSGNLTQVLRDFRPDLVHAIQPGPLGVKALRAASDLGVPSITSFHTDFIHIARSLGFDFTSELMWSTLREVHELSSLTLVPSYIQKMTLRDQGYDHIEYWSRGVDTDLFSPKRRSSAWRRHLSEGETQKTVLVYAGRLKADRHVELLRPVIEANPQCRLVIAGAGPESGWLRDHFEGTPTLFTGYLDQGDLAEVFASSDVFVHPATAAISPVATLEAMASGLPVLAPHSASIVDFAVHGENSLLVIPGDTDQAAAYVSELAAKPTLTADLGRVARHTALSRTWQKSFDQLHSYYERLFPAQAVSLPIQIRDTVAVPDLG